MSHLEDVFLTIVNMSITASFVAAGVLLVRLLLKKAPKIFSYILWAPVLFRLICPVSFRSELSFLSLLNLYPKREAGFSRFVPRNTGLAQTPALGSGAVGVGGAVNASLPAAAPAGANIAQIWISVLSLIWISGVIALLIYSAASYVKTRRMLRTATRVKGNVFETDAIGTAFVCGFIRPKIYVPAHIGDADMAYILEHERTHIRRKDYLVKPLAFLALVLHWFNPLIWLCFALMSRDMEMSCDESVLRRLGDGAKCGYSNTLLSLAVKRKGLLAAGPLAFGENHAKGRIKNVLSFKKPAFWVIVVAVVAVCAAVIAFAANPSANAAYTSEDYKISLRYPSGWKPNPYYIERYEGTGGFFQVGAIDGAGLTIDEVAENEAFHRLSPYGTKPQILSRTVDGQEARLILPSVDQPEDMRNQAGLIVRYPQAVQINGSMYHYLILWADKAHIEKIGNTLAFLGIQAGDISPGGIAPESDEAETEKTLDEYVSEAIIAYNKPLFRGGEYQMFATEYHKTLKTVNQGDTVTVYLVALYMQYQYKDNEIVLTGASCVPVAITFKMEDSGYTLLEYWEPENGVSYAPSIREKFPSDIAKAGIYTSMEADGESICLQRAQEYFARQSIEEQVPSGRTEISAAAS